MDNTDPQQIQDTTSPQNPPVVNPPIVSSPWQAAPIIDVPTQSPWQTNPVASTPKPESTVTTTTTSTTPPANPIPQQNVSPWQTPPTVNQSEAVTTTTTSTATTPPANPIPQQNVSPWQSTPAQAQPISVTPLVSTGLEDVPLPATKKGGIPPAILGVLMLFLVAGVGGGTFLLSRGVSSSESIAPNAPQSEPKAFDPSEESGMTGITPTLTEKQARTKLDDANYPFIQSGEVDCSDIPETAPYGNKCVAVVTLPSGEVTWAPGALDVLGAKELGID